MALKRGETSARSVISGAPRARIGILVVNYRTPELVLELVDSLRGQLDEKRDHVVVVDNASGDDSCTLIEDGIAGLPHVSLVRSPVNGGFGAGNNLAARHVDADAYLLLNSDTRVLPGAIDRLFSRLQSDDAIGMVGPRIEDPEGTVQASCFRFPTPVSELIAGSATGPITRVLARWVVPMDAADAAAEPEWTSFAAVMIRRSLFDAVGGFDEGYFLYFEDIDFCWKARRLGARIAHEPSARIIHLESQSTAIADIQRQRRRRPRYYYESRARYFRKAYGRAGLWSGNALWTLGWGIALLRETFGSKVPHVAQRELLDRWRS